MGFTSGKHSLNFDPHIVEIFFLCKQRQTSGNKCVRRAKKCVCVLDFYSL